MARNGFLAETVACTMHCLERRYLHAIETGLGAILAFFHGGAADMFLLVQRFGMQGSGMAAGVSISWRSRSITHAHLSEVRPAIPRAVLHGEARS